MMGPTACAPEDAPEDAAERMPDHPAGRQALKVPDICATSPGASPSS
ncbi:hypothetical protein AHiyo8_46240 [Arthrobacter sp. Hiyo8]|nr:hypothetical protein AHiyo8_46240 [Arthrobacter sp. Hiyo8]